jgi:hypothetical protein
MAMTDLPDEIERALAALPRQQEPDPGLEERVMRAVYPPRRARRWPWAATGAALAAALVLLIARPWSPARRSPVPTYILLLSEPPTFYRPAPADSLARIHDYARWADSLDHQGKLELEGHLDPPGAIDGLFIIRAANDSEAARIAATCPHLKYGGHIEIRRFFE